MTKVLEAEILPIHLPDLSKCMAVTCRLVKMRLCRTEKKEKKKCNLVLSATIDAHRSLILSAVMPR